MRALCFLLLLCPLLLPSSAQAETQKPIQIVASFSLLADMIHQVGGKDVTIISLIGVDQDAHSYSPAPEDARHLVHADLIAMNGLHFEGWMSRLIEASGTKAKLLIASAGVKPRLLEEDGEEGPAIDPHAWQDPKNAVRYVQNIAAALCEVRPAQCTHFQSESSAYIKQIMTLNKKLEKEFAALPKAKRKIITNHDAFGYFGQAYDIAFLAPMGLSTEEEPSAKAISLLMEQIKKEEVHDLFIENMTSPKLMEQLAKDAKAHLGGTLYADALSGPSGPAPNYLQMINHNAAQMLKAMTAP